MARPYQPRLSYEDRQAMLEAERQDRIARMRATGYTDAGERIEGWSGSTPRVAAITGNVGGGASLTPKGIWDSMFRNKFTGTNPLAAPTVAPTQTSARSEFGVGLQQNASPVAPPSLTTLANGGQNHAQIWMSGEAKARSDAAPYVAPGTTPVTTYDGTPGTRQPFIAGANGVNVGPTIAAKVSQNDPTLDRNYVNSAGGVPNSISAIPAPAQDWKRQFSWSSAFAR